MMQSGATHQQQQPHSNSKHAHSSSNQYSNSNHGSSNSKNNNHSSSGGSSSGNSQNKQPNHTYKNAAHTTDKQGGYQGGQSHHTSSGSGYYQQSYYPNNPGPSTQGNTSATNESNLNSSTSNTKKKQNSSQMSGGHQPSNEKQLQQQYQQQQQQYVKKTQSENTNLQKSGQPQPNLQKKPNEQQQKQQKSYQASAQIYIILFERLISAHLSRIIAMILYAEIKSEKHQQNQENQLQQPSNQKQSRKRLSKNTLLQVYRQTFLLGANGFSTDLSIVQQKYKGLSSIKPVISSQAIEPEAQNDTNLDLDMNYCQATQHNLFQINPVGGHGGYGQGANRDSHRNGNYPNTNAQNKSSSRASGAQQQQTGYGHNNYNIAHKIYSRVQSLFAQYDCLFIFINRDGLQDSKNHKLSPFKQNYADNTKTREEENMGSNAGFKNLRHQDPLRPPPSIKQVYFN